MSLKANHRRQPVYSDDSEQEEDFLYTDLQLVRGGGKHEYGYERDNRDFKLKINIYFFSRNLNIEDFINWIAEIDKFFDYMEVSKEKMVKLVACRLKGGGSAQWERLQNRRLREGKQPVKTWYQMKQLLKKDFLPPDYEQILFQQYQRCNQGVRTVHEYTAEFIRLAERNDLRESEGQQPARYLEGLKPQIRDKIGVQVMRNLHEAKNLALKAKFMMQDRGRCEPPRRNYGGKALRAPVERGVTSREPQMMYDKFKEEKEAGKQKVTEVKEAPKLANPYARPAPIKCFKYNQTSRRSSDCSLRKVVNLAVREEEGNDEVCCEPDGYEEEDEIYKDDDKGRNYVVRKLY